MKLIATEIPKHDMSFIWITDHYDIHIKGLCSFKGSLCSFQCDNVGTDEEPMYSIYSLSMFEKLRWLYDKKKFEVCVGRHWSYYSDGIYRPFTRYKIRWLGALLWGWQYGNFKAAFKFYYNKR